MEEPSARRSRDSSRTRVKPVLDRISRSADWIPRLLSLPNGSGVVPADLDLTVLRCVWGDPEPCLAAPPSLLRWLVQNLDRDPAPTDSRHSSEMRRRLRRRDPEAVQVALAGLEREQDRGRWWVLEGPTYPDALIETPDSIIVLEGKRTERKPTRQTTWMRTRDQMLRHMDCAWEVRGRRHVLGLLIVEEQYGALPQGWANCAAETVEDSLVRGSLPHRTGEERAAIAAGFLGVTTWQEVCRAFDLDPSGLPDTVQALEGGARGGRYSHTPLDGSSEVEEFS
jgi:hypothetical protein